MTQTIITTIIVAIAAFYAIKRYAPTWLVRKLGAWASIGMAAIGLVQFSKRIAQTWTVESPSGKSCGSGCGSCSGCGSNVPVVEVEPASPKSAIRGDAMIVVYHKKS